MRYASLFALVCLAACTNKDGDDTDVDTDTDTDTEVDTAVEVYDLTVVASGLINGSATVSVDGTDVLVESNGSATFAESLPGGSVATLDVTAPTGQVCTLDAPTEPISGDTTVTLTCVCDWIEGVETPTYEVDIATNGLGAQLVPATRRGFDAVFEATCGGVEHRVLDTTMALDAPESSDWPGARFRYLQGSRAVGDAVYGIALVQSTARGGPPSARVLYRAAAPDFVPEPLLAQVDGVNTDGAIRSINEYDVGLDGTVAVLARVRVNGTFVDQTLILDGSDWVEGITIDSAGETPELCGLRDVHVTGPGEATVLAVSGAPCLGGGGARRGRSASTYSELVAFDQSGTSRTVLSSGDALDDGYTLTDIYSAQTGADGQVLLAVAQCAPNELCSAYSGSASFEFDGIVRVDLASDTPTTLLTAQEDVGGFTALSFDGPWDASPEGDVVALASAIDSTCEGRCVIEPALMRSVGGSANSLGGGVQGSIELSEDLLDGPLSLNADGTVVFTSNAYSTLRGRPVAFPSVLCWADELTSAYGPTSDSTIDDTLNPFVRMWSAGSGQFAAYGQSNLRGIDGNSLLRSTCSD